MKDLDLCIGTPTADAEQNANTGNPCAVVPYKLAVPVVQQGGRASAAAAPPAAPLNQQPICAVITGALYRDDTILAVAHQFQVHTDVSQKHPSP